MTESSDHREGVLCAAAAAKMAFEDATRDVGNGSEEPDWVEIAAAAIDAYLGWTS